MCASMSSDFDFLRGSWVVAHRKLADTLDPTCTTWLEFETRATNAPVLGGWGNSDETAGTLPDGSEFRGYSLRLYEPVTGEWRIWWAAAANPGVLDAPVVGRFQDGSGTFVGPAEHDGRPFLARFRWTQTQDDEPVWSQDFSFDDGASWAPVNWTMTHTRASAAAAPTLADGKLCHVELVAGADVYQATADFYARVFGWRLHALGGAIAFDDPTGEVSGHFVVDRPAGEPGVLVYIWVDDIDDAIARVTAAGGELLRDVGGDPGELTARFRDPGGNVVGLYQEPPSD